VASECAPLLPSFPLPSYDTSPSRLGHTISSAYIVTFQTHVFSVLPASFAAGFKRLLAATLALSTEGVTPDIPASVQDSRLWPSFELLGLADRYESLIASVCYEHIEKHVVETCTGKWDEPMLSQLREWMAEKVVPWMLLPYARGAKTGAWPVPSPPLPVLSLDSYVGLSAEEARTMLQGVGSRFDFHVCKTLCDLR
jgi:anaphase-promoting complex subunit 2